MSIEFIYIKPLLINDRFETTLIQTKQLAAQCAAVGIYCRVGVS